MIDYFEHADKAEAETEAQKATGVCNEGRPGTKMRRKIQYFVTTVSSLINLSNSKQGFSTIFLGVSQRALLFKFCVPPNLASE